MLCIAKSTTRATKVAWIVQELKRHTIDWRNRGDIERIMDKAAAARPGPRGPHLTHSVESRY
jgi:hypothetical protein